MRLQLLSLASVLALPLALHAAQSPTSAAAQTEQAVQPDQVEAAAATPAQPASSHVMYDAAGLEWGEAPPQFERGAQAVVLSGDPGKAGMFVLRLKAPAGFKIANHWHPTDEHVTLLEGDLTVKMNQDAGGAREHTFSPGGYVLLPAKMHHASSTQNGMTLQVSGMGPFELNYVDPKDDPRKRPAP